MKIGSRSVLCGCLLFANLAFSEPEPRDLPSEGVVPSKICPENGTIGVARVITHYEIRGNQGQIFLVVVVTNIDYARLDRLAVSCGKTPLIIDFEESKINVEVRNHHSGPWMRGSLQASGQTVFIVPQSRHRGISAR